MVFRVWVITAAVVSDMQKCEEQGWCRFAGAMWGQWRTWKLSAGTDQHKVRTHLSRVCENNSCPSQSAVRNHSSVKFSCSVIHTTPEPRFIHTMVREGFPAHPQVKTASDPRSTCRDWGSVSILGPTGNKSFWGHLIQGAQKTDNKKMIQILIMIINLAIFIPHQFICSFIDSLSIRVVQNIATLKSFCTQMLSLDMPLICHDIDTTVPCPQCLTHSSDSTAGIKLLAVWKHCLQLYVLLQLHVASAAAGGPDQQVLVENEKGKSLVWKYFAYEAIEQGKPRPWQPVCKQCFKVVAMKVSSTMNLTKRLEDLHPGLHDKFWHYCIKLFTDVSLDSGPDRCWLFF